MVDPRRLLRGGPKEVKYPIVTLLAILVVIGVLPAVVVSLGTIAISTATVAVIWLLARRFGVIPA